MDRKDANLTPFKTPFQDPLIEMGKENAKQVQDPISRPLRTYNEESLVVSDHELLEQPTEDLATEFETPFKTLQINGIRVSSEKDIDRRVISRPQPMVHETVESNRDKS